MKNTFNLRYNVYTITQKVYIHLPFNWKGDRYLIIIKIQTSFGMKKYTILASGEIFWSVNTLNTRIIIHNKDIKIVIQNFKSIKE